MDDYEPSRMYEHATEHNARLRELLFRAVTLVEEHCPNNNAARTFIAAADAEVSKKDWRD